MGNNQRIEGITQNDNPFMESFGQKYISVPTGVYHLVYDHEWVCAFVSDDCLEIFGCSRENFLDVLLASAIFVETDETEIPVSKILQKFSRTSERQICTGIIRYGNEGKRNIKITFTSFAGKDDQIQLYGHLVDNGILSLSNLKNVDNANGWTAKAAQNHDAGSSSVADDIAEQVHELVQLGQTIYDAKRRYNIAKKAQELYQALLHYLDDMEATVLEAELNSGEFRLIYNSNPDYKIKMPESPFEKFAQFFGIDQIHPDDRERYLEEIQFCHGPFFEQGERRHSIYSRMYRPTTKEYQLHEFITLRMNMEDEDCRNVILICRPVKDELNSIDMRSNGLLESSILHDILCGTLRCKDDENLTMISGMNYLCELTGYTVDEFRELFSGKLLELICPENRAKTLQELKEQLAHDDAAEMEFSVHTKSGKKIWLLGSCSRAIGENGESILYCLFIESTRIRRGLEAEKQQLKEQVQKADYDAMTGLLRRDVGEMRICKYLSDQAETGGILIILDLDDLKGINDTLGHSYGDKAIIGIANALKSNFRKDDILIRAGGDEFIAFLPGTGDDVSSVRLAVAGLLQKLSTILIGDNHERTIHCSIGCAVEIPGADTFDSLYQRADIALYHVKRSGKNNFAFFEPAMQEDSYGIKRNQALPVTNEAASEKELKHLLEVVSVYYPGIVLFNLTQNYFRILTVGSNVESVLEPNQVDMFWENWRENVHPDDQERVISAMSRTSLLSLYGQGHRAVRHYYRNLESIGYVKTEVSVQFYTADDGDICAFLFFRWGTESEKGVEIAGG